MQSRSITIPPSVQDIISTATREDMVLIDRFHILGISEAFKPDQQHQNISFHGCSDGHRIHLWKQHLELCRPENGGCFHPFMDHGQSLRLPAHSPLADPVISLDKVTQTHLAYTEVKPCIQQIVLTHHWPCRAALLANMTMLESLAYFVCGKLRLRYQLPKSPPIALLFKADGPDGIAITDRISAKNFIDWLEEEEKPELKIIQSHKKALVGLNIFP